MKLFIFIFFVICITTCFAVEGDYFDAPMVEKLPEPVHYAPIPHRRQKSNKAVVEPRFRQKHWWSSIKQKANQAYANKNRFAEENKPTNKKTDNKPTSTTPIKDEKKQQTPAASKRRPTDIEDCTACRFIWLQVEAEVGNSQVEANIYDAFSQSCINAQKAAIFYPACEDMFDDVYGMIGDYMDGYTVNQMCEAAKLCR